jgi:hypothetical protein
LRLEFGIDLGQSEVDDHASFGIRVIEEVARLDVPMVDAQVLQILQSYEQLVDVVLHLFDGEGIEEGLPSGQTYDEGLKLEVLQHDMRNIVMDEQVHQLGQVLSILYQQQKGHLRVNELPRDSVEIDLDGELLVALSGCADRLR